MQQELEGPDGVQGSSPVGTRSSIRHGTGPRTDAGKEKSKRNATTHGIFSSVIVLNEESREDYQSMLDGLNDAWQPAGMLEVLLVEKLAVLFWRQRRLLAAEGAEIQINIELAKRNQLDSARQEAERMGTPFAFKFQGVMMGNIKDPDVLELCLKMLAELRQGIETGFENKRDSLILEKLYGEYTEKSYFSHRTLYEGYMNWLRTAEMPENERQRKQYADPEKCKQCVLFDIDAEIERLKNYKKIPRPIESEHTKLEIEILRRYVPDCPVLDRLLRYEAALERALDRTLSQLERLQRLRRGQPVAPRIDVNISG